MNNKLTVRKDDCRTLIFSGYPAGPNDPPEVTVALKYKEIGCNVHCAVILDNIIIPAIVKAFAKPKSQCSVCGKPARRGKTKCVECARAIARSLDA